MRPTITNVLFLLMVLFITMGTPVNAQFGSSTDGVLTLSHEIDPFGQSMLNFNALRCMKNNQMFFSYAKRSEIGDIWIDQTPLIPIGLPPMSAGSTKQVRLNLKLTPGTYRFTPVPSLARYGNENSNVDETRYCRSDLDHYSLTQSLVFTVGGQAEAVPGLPVILAGDQYVAMRNRIARFRALLPNATRLTFSQRKADGKIAFFVIEQPATPGDFQEISVDLPGLFDGALPIDISAVDKVNDMGVARQLLEPNPVLVDSTRTNR